VVYLVRHAHAGRKSEWHGPDLVRPLSAEGRRQAIGLIDRLAAFPVRRILSSRADRCLQTVEPLAARRGYAVEPNDVLGVDGSGAEVLELLGDRALDHAVLCTHGEVIGQLFEELRGVGVELSSRPMWPKGSTWVLDRDGARIWRGSYLHPLSIGSPAQARC
jgi:broad specificity phosphatase PhoE